MVIVDFRREIDFVRFFFFYVANVLESPVLALPHQSNAQLKENNTVSATIIIDWANFIAHAGGN